MANETVKDIVNFNRVSKTYNGSLALDNVTFSIREGEVLGYIGPNGAGKTTTIKLMVGLLKAFGGAVSIDGRPPVNGTMDLYKILGYLPQNVAFQEWRTVVHVLQTFGSLSGIEATILERRIDEMLDLVGLSWARKKKVRELSGGMKQRLGLAQALLHEPKLLVMDEPLNGLDPEGRHQLKQIVRKLSDRGTAVFFSSHILSDVQDIADRIAILNKGRLLAIGTVRELEERLASAKAIDIEFSAKEDMPVGDLEFPFVVGVERIGDGKLRLQLSKGTDMDTAIQAVGRRLFEAGRRMRCISPYSVSLEKVYLSYVNNGGVC